MRALRTLLISLPLLLLAAFLIHEFATDGPLDQTLYYLLDKERNSVLSAIIAGLSTLLAATFGIFGSWLAFVKTPRRLARIQHKLAYTEDQLAELYGPLLGEIKTAQAAYRELLLRLNHPREEVDLIMQGYSALNPYEYLGGHSDEDRREWARFTKDYFLPSNERILNLISSKQHLIGPEPMHCLEEFFDHEAEYRVRFTTWESTRKPDTHPGATWPSRMQSKVALKVELLLALQKKYRLQMSNDPVPTELRSRIKTLLQESRDPAPETKPDA